MVVEEMRSLGMLSTSKLNEADKLKSVEDAAEDDLVEVEPGEEGRHNKLPVNALKARKIKEEISKLKVQEFKLAKALGETRARIKKHGRK